MTKNFPNFFDLQKSIDPLTIGFEKLFDDLKGLSSNLKGSAASYPPYNIKQVDDNKYVIEMAVAGFGKQDIEITTQDGVLAIRGQVNNEAGDYIFKGIADRAFTRTFTLADTVEVKNADLFNGMLKIWLERFIPEEKKPKKININSEEATTSKKELLTESE